MRAAEKKEALVVVFIIVAVFLFFAWYTINGYTKVINVFPEQETVLADSDFIIGTMTGNIIVGKSTRGDVKNIYAEGKDLGKSGVYRPKDLDLLLSFTKKENVLTKMDIGSSGLFTSRGIAVNDSFDKVIEKYGPNYVRAYKQETPQIFDAFYGSDKYILFKVENNIVKKIIIGSPLPK